MGQINFPNGSSGFARESTKLHKLFSSTGLQYSNDAPINYVETIAASSGGVSPSTITPYGVSYIAVAVGNPSTSPLLATMGAPIPGVSKTIVFTSTAAYANTLDISLSGAALVGTSGLNFIAFSSLAEQTQTVNLMGITTALWNVQSVDSTLGTFGLATGIRGTTAARTS